MNALCKRLNKIFTTFRDKTAITESFSGRSVTYGELDLLSGKIAACLRARGAGRREIVPIVLTRGIDYIAAEIGAMKAGCAYAPLLPEYPKDRIRYIQNDCKAAFVIDEAFVAEAASFEPLTEDFCGEEGDPLLLLYTSGSTGNPKGVLHTRRSFFDGVKRNIKNNGMSEKDVTLGIVTFSFAFSVVEIYDTLLSGGSLLLLDNEERKDLGFIKRAILENNVTALYINPNLLKRLRLGNSSLRVAQTTGERLSDFYTDEYRLINLYGASETFCALSFTLDKAYTNTPIGTPCEGIRVWLLGEDGREVPDGEAGEICVSGTLAEGYWNLAEETRAAFTPNPFSKEPGFARLYHTGDLGQKLPNGNILFVNRKDWMVKINGQRVETGEIEVRLASDVEAVEAAVVKAFENEYGQTYLAAFYTVKNGESVTADSIEKTLREKLPGYMIPRFFVELPAFPLNANGKIDRKSIAAPLAASFKAAYAPPENETERLLSEAFETLLRCGRVGANDDFFALGGDSLLAMSLPTDCGVKGLTTEMLYAGKTPRKIAALLAAASPEDVQAVKLSEYPLNPFERGMYIEQKLSPASKMYSLLGYYEISGADAEAVLAALSETFRAHEAFHSVYRERNGELLRVLADEIPEITVEKIENLSDGYALAKEHNRPYDLSAGIPAKAIIYTDGKSCLLALLYHHILFDGASDRIFAKELLARLTGGTVAPDPFDLGSASALDKESLYEAGFEKYRQMFEDGVPVTELPLKAARPKTHPQSNANHKFVIDEDRLTSLRQTAREKSTTVFNLLLAAFAMTAAKYCAAEDLVIGVPVNTRDKYTKDTIGMFVNTAPLRLKPARDKKADIFLSEVGEAVSEYIKKNLCPYDRLVAAFAKERNPGRNPLFDVGINYLHYGEEYALDDVKIRTSYQLQPSGKDLNFVLQAGSDSITGYAQYSTELFDSTVVENFIEQFLAAAQALCDGADTVREALRLPAAQKKVLEAFATEARAEIPVKLLHKMFEAAADAHPDRAAVIACDRVPRGQA